MINLQITDCKDNNTQLIITICPDIVLVMRVRNLYICNRFFGILI